MNDKNPQILHQRLKYLMLRYFGLLPEMMRKLLLLRALLSRAWLVRALLGSLLVVNLNVRPVRADGPSFTPYNPLAKVAVGQFSSPTFADLDGDGDLDAFVGEYNGNVLYFENVGSSGSPIFAVPQTNPFGLADVGMLSNPTFVDIDADGDLDAFIGIGGTAGNAGSTVYRENVGTPTTPAFGLAQLNPFGLTDVGNAGRPSFADIDDDGDFDAFIGNFNGDTIYFQNNGSPTGPAFAAPATNPFGLANVGGFSTPTFVDINGDGDLDAFLGEFGGDINYFQNTGTPDSPAFAAPVLNPLGLANVGLYTIPAFSDIDGDGDLDAFIGEQHGITNYFENTGSVTGPAFSLFPANPFGLTDAGDQSSPTFADINNDGDLDAFVGNRDGNILYFQNTGSPTSPVFGAPATNPFGLADVGYNNTPTLADIDGDGDLDVFIGEKYGNIIYRTNIGSAASPSFGGTVINPFGLADVGDYSRPIIVDIDDDNDLDAFIGNLDGNTIYFENTGNATTPSFGPAQTNPFGLTDVGAYSSPTFADVDGDGDLDAFVGVGGPEGGPGGPGPASGNVVYFENIGSATSPAFGGAQTNPFGLADIGSRNSPTLVNIDGDGDFDALIGETDGRIFFFGNNASTLYLPLIFKNG